MYSCNKVYCTEGTGSASYGVSESTSSGSTVTSWNRVVPVPVRRWPKPSQSSMIVTPARSAGTMTIATES